VTDARRFLQQLGWLWVAIFLALFLWIAIGQRDEARRDLERCREAQRP
jgi:hypothetical protein